MNTATPDLHHLTSYGSAHPEYVAPAVMIALFAVLLTVWAVTSRRRQATPRVQLDPASTAGRRAENVLTLVAAGIATAVQATGMWKFFGNVLGFAGPLRILLFAFIELAVFTSALRARNNVKESADHTAGVDGVAVWTLTGLSAVLATIDAASFAEGIFRLSAPLVAAWLWERGLSVERRRRTGKHGIHWRLTPERVLVRLGIAEASDRTAGDVDAHRRLARLTRAAHTVRRLRATGARQSRQRRALRVLDRAMDAAVEHTGLADDPSRQEALIAQLGARFNAAALVDLAPPAPWTAAPAVPVPVVADAWPDPRGHDAHVLDVTDTDRPKRRTSRASGRPGDRRSDRATGGRPADREADALALLTGDPDLTGAELGRRLGVSERTGRRLHTRVLPLLDTAPEPTPQTTTAPESAWQEATR